MQLHLPPLPTFLRYPRILNNTCPQSGAPSQPSSSPSFPSDSASRSTIRGTSGSTFSSQLFMPRATSPPSPARGVTPFLDHIVMTAHPLHSAQIRRGEDTLGLLLNPLKLVEMQRVIPDDPDGSPSISLQTGDVYLNLAEYVGQGRLEMGYLLRERKTNTTPKWFTIKLEHIGGETRCTPPLLPKGEILTGIAGFLENHVYRIRP